MNASRRVLYFSRFDPTIERGGGSRRALQIRELLEPHEVEIVSAPRRDWLGEKEGRETDQPDASDLMYRLLATRGDYLTWSSSRRNGTWRLRRISNLWRERLEHHGPYGPVLMDDPVYFPGLAEALFSSRARVVAVVHNIESQVPSSVVSLLRRKFEARETNLLRRCRLALTIAEQETRFLQERDVPAQYIPSYPPRKIEEALLEVRGMRPRQGKGILLLGSTVNRETREGMDEVIAFWRKSGLERTGEKLIVAGFGTDQHFFGLPREGPISFLGPLPADLLRELLTTVRAALCYQRRGGGALTRIAEFLVAGVPVIANTHAARSYRSSSGLVRISGLEELPEALRAVSAVEQVDLPVKPEASGELLALLEDRLETP